MDAGRYPSMSRRYAAVLKFSSDVRAGTGGRALPILFESVVLDVRYQCGCSDVYYCHLETALCERQCKITKKSLKNDNTAALFCIDIFFRQHVYACNTE